jgi:DNA-binding GntR family transcriptional regulator
MPRASQRPPVTMSGELTARIMFAGRSSSLSAQIVSHVRDALFAKQIKPGDFLGTEKDLAAQFGTSRIVARDALRTLEALGIVEIRMGKGGGARIAHPRDSHQARRSHRAARRRRRPRADGRPRQDDPRPARRRTRAFT